MEQKWKNFLTLNLGLIIFAAGLNFFSTPFNFAIGGVSGIAIILNAIVPGINVATIMLVLNVALLILGLIFLGKNCGFSTIYASVALSAYVWLFELIWPVSGPFTSDILLALIYAITFQAIGSAIVFNIGSSTGGIDIIAMILNKYAKLEMGNSLLVSNFLITLFAGTVFGIENALYCMLGLVMKSLLVDMGIEKINSRKYVTIISGEHNAICDFIINTLKRGATVHTGYGAYSHDEKEIITVILTNRQVVDLRNFIKGIDPKAFISVTNSSETIGKGFRAL